MVKRRSGTGKIGCLLMLLVVAFVGYFGEKAGGTFWNYYLFLDRMQTEARFAAHRSDAVIKYRLAEFADSLALPEGARNVIVRRTAHNVFIYAEYYEHLELPGTVREIHFSPSATGAF